MKSDREHITGNGIFYTPEAVADALAAGLVERLPSIGPKILDPSCGNGALLDAAKHAIDTGWSRKIRQRCRFVGRDLFRPESWPVDSRGRFEAGNFFDMPESAEYDGIIMNPPYIQYGRIDNDTRDRLYERFGKSLCLSRGMDLWAYFVLKALHHLKQGAAVAAAIPWSFIEAKFAVGLRHHLAQTFGDISVRVLRDRHFDDTEKRVVLVWLSSFGSSASSARLAFSGTVQEKPQYHTLSIDEWAKSSHLGTIGVKSQDALQLFRKAGFKRLGDLASVTIGVVTGANAFFISPLDDARRLGFSDASSTPIYTHVNQLRGLVASEVPEGVLLRFKRMTKARLDYIKRGKKQKIDNASHCRRRETSGRRWYDVDVGTVPDAIFTYRVSTVPFLVLNPNGFQCTNTLHKVKFKGDLTENQRKWIQVSLLSQVGQLSIEAGARHYGNGILKVEPYLLKDALVLPSRRPIAAAKYEEISRLLANCRKEEAVIRATEIVRGNCRQIGNGAWRDVKQALQALRLRRNGV
jgi:hypothetical protein